MSIKFKDMDINNLTVDKVYYKDEQIWANEPNEKEFIITVSPNAEICRGVGSCSGTYNISSFPASDTKYPNLKEVKSITVNVKFDMIFPIQYTSAIVNSEQFANNQTTAFEVSKNIGTSRTVSVSATYDRHSGQQPVGLITLVSYQAVCIFSN